VVRTVGGVRTSYSHAVGLLLASEISAGNTPIRDMLIDSAQGRDEVGAMGHQVVIGLLASSDPASWAVVESMLLQAQRQEGLRQAILETVDFAHPEAFRRVLAVIVENKLIRFAATVRAASVWFGEGFHARRIALPLRHQHLR